MQGRPLWETSHRTFLARHDRHALGARFLIFPWDLVLGSMASATSAPLPAIDTSTDMLVCDFLPGEFGDGGWL